MGLLKRSTRLAKNLDLARSTMGDFSESHLDPWKLTDPERDVARLLMMVVNSRVIADAQQIRCA